MARDRIDPHPPHGGDLDAVRDRAGETASGDWIDLSTGINPWPHPVPPLEAGLWARLPPGGGLDRMIEAARACYRVPDEAGIAAAPGSEALIHLLPALFSPGKVAVLGPTYASHAHAWRLAGHEVVDIADADELPDDARALVLANPNNPDGRVFRPDEILRLAERLRSRGGHLIVDEAFADVAPDISAIPLVPSGNLVVLRSFGKFFGLAGLRLGFAVAAPDMAARLAARLGAWPVSGPAQEIAARALADEAWQAQTRVRLARAAGELDRVLKDAGLAPLGGTSLFRLAAYEKAQALFDHLLKHRIYVRRFGAHPAWLRFGLPPGEKAALRLADALFSFHAGEGG